MKSLAGVALGLLISFGLSNQAQADEAVYVPVAKYDPTRDAAADIKAASAEATRSGRFVLLEIGGEWCIWCHYLDRFLASEDKIRQAWEETFVVVMVNYSRENKNEKVLGQYPEIPGYPHFIILGPDGKFLEDQRTDVLESGKSYSRKKFLAFVEKWQAKRPTAR